MENLVEFEKSDIFKMSSLGLAFFNTLFFFSHIYLINKLNKSKDNIKKIIDETSCLNIIFQLISSSFFFVLLNKIYIQNTKFLSISYLIGVVTSFEWYSIYIYYYHKSYDNKKIIITILYSLIPFIIFILILLFFLLTDNLSKKVELILKHISFIFFIFMFISPGFNIFKCFTIKNNNYIMILNSILGIFLNVGMILFIISLSYYSKVLELYFICYPIISLLICLFEVTYHIFKNKGSYNIKGEIGDLDEDSDMADSNKQKISLVNKTSMEDD